MQRCKANREDVFFEEQIPSILFCSKTQKYEHLHNSQDEVSRQEDVPLRKDAFYTNSIQKDFPMQKKFHIYNPIEKKFPNSYKYLNAKNPYRKIFSQRHKFQIHYSAVKHKNTNLCITTEPSPFFWTEKLQILASEKVDSEKESI